MAEPLYITESEVASLLDMRGTVNALESMFRLQADGRAKNSPRQRAEYWGARLNMMSAGQDSGRFAYKAYCGTGAGTVYHVALFDAKLGLLAIVEAGILGQLRTGAATGVATDLMAPKEASTLGMIGSGRQARTQLQAVATVRKLKSARIYSRRADKLAQFCDDMARELSIDVKPAASAEACVAGAEIVVTATNASSPVVMDAWLTGDVHVNAMGANGLARMEVEISAYARADAIVTDDIEQSKLEAGEFLSIVKDGKKGWNDIRELRELVPAGGLARRGGLTMFKSLGAAVEDLAAASAVYDRAMAMGHARKVPR
jgi:ornithine cyclodeaminase/alanine dehydrogenase